MIFKTNESIFIFLLDNILSAVNMKVKIQIMDEFAVQESILQSNKNGYFLSKNVGLYHYKHRYEEWKEIEREKERKRKTFSDLIDDTKMNDRFDDNNYGQNSSTDYRQLTTNYEHSNSHQASYSNRNRDYDNNNGHSSHFKKPRGSSFKPSPFYNKSSKY